jgi:chromosome segregation protein
MKGFKSFADNTVLEFEPGVTAVVGPNGAGKSNVVDAVTWVLGAQSTRALRSAKMDDVIFMGTTHRAALGRAEVALTIDNASGRLQIDSAEVTISRTLFRNGDSEYAINGTTCRLLDVQELLGDSGVGRQQHMIIGQGQLDSILNSSSENRRAVIEEAAGVLKHRRRKERAERRLVSTQENLERLGDLVREVRRQMRPLERQAASARSFADVRAELDAARRALYATRLDTFDVRRGELEGSLEGLEKRERDLRHELVTLDALAANTAAEMASRREEMLASTLGTLQGLAERARGTASIIQERERSLRTALVASADENVIANLEADAARLADELETLSAVEAQMDVERAALGQSMDELHIREEEFAVEWGSNSLAGDEAALAAARERVALLERSLASLYESQRRCALRLDDSRARYADAMRSREIAVSDHDDAQNVVAEMEQHHLAAEQEAERTERGRFDADEALREVTDVAARTQARAEALARALEEFSGAGGRAILGGLDGVLGAFVDLVEIDQGWERAVESAAGASVGAMVVEGRVPAHAALEVLRREGGAGLILAVGDHDIIAPDSPQGCTPLRSLVRARRGSPSHVTRVLDALFSRAFVAGDWESGIEVAIGHPELVIVTREGDRFASSGWRVASGRAVVTRSAVEEAEIAARSASESVAPTRQRRIDADENAQRARQQLNEATTLLAQARAAVERHRRDTLRHGVVVDELEPAISSLDLELGGLLTQCVTIEQELVALGELSTSLEDAVRNASDHAVAQERARSVLDELRSRVGARATALSRHEAELAERRRLIEQRRAEIEQRLVGRTSERAEAASRRGSLEFDLRALTRLAVMIERAADEIRVAQEAMDSTYREQLEASRAGAERLEEVRRARAKAEMRLTELSEVKRRAEIERAELAVKIANLHEMIVRDLGVEPCLLGPAPPIELPDDVSVESRVAELEARITSLGPINPLALDELAALEERYRELDAQVSDVRHARRELQEVIRALDEEIMQTFSSAVADVNEHFSDLVGKLFPGGQGRLILTEPDDPLNTGVEIEVRPMGRNVRRLSLLSGGERSMAALAFLFAVFRSRPSPFYLMDEVEAALDDVNLLRFLSLIDEFRDDAQLLIVTHQKRTMEAADALYGVTMVPGGSSKVVSQRVRRDGGVTV